MGVIANFENEQQLDERLSEPTEGTIETLSHLKGDLILLGSGGKMGPTLAKMARRAAQASGNPMRILGVSRFSNEKIRRDLESAGIETLAADLLEKDALESLPNAENVIYMAGWKFGSTGKEDYTWAMNTLLPARVAERYRNANIVAFSTGNVYPFSPIDSNGPTENDPVGPVGEYAQSCLGRERMFQYFSNKYNTPVVLIRLNYAVEMRYGILLDIARKVFERHPIPLAMGYVNLIWQGDANAQTLQCFDRCACPPKIINLTGPEVYSVRQLATMIGKRMDVEPIFEGQEESTALLNNASQAMKLFGPPRISVEQLVEWVADWVRCKKSTFNKPTHYEGREGKF